MSHRITKNDQVLAWVLAQPIGSVLTPTSVARSMSREDMAFNTGTASKVLRTLVTERRAKRVNPNPYGAPRGGFRLQATVLPQPQMRTA